jgi:hypothetical protein
LDVDAGGKNEALKTITIIGNIIVWILLPLSLLIALAALFWAQEFPVEFSIVKVKLISAAMLIALRGPAVVLFSAIVSLILRIIKCYIWSICFELIPLFQYLMMAALFTIAKHIN